MKPFKLAAIATLCGALTLAPCRAQNAPATANGSAVDVPPSQQTMGIAGFPALEVLPGRDENMAIVVARESPLQGPITYSTGYFTTTKTFTPPQFFSFSIYGYYEKPQWGEIRAVNFKFGPQTFSAKPLYIVQGPDRDRSQDAQPSAYFETMVVQLPPDIARKIVANKGVLVTTEPKSFYLPIAASQLERFQQLVASVDAISKNQAGKGADALAAPARNAPGLPLTELANDQTRGRAVQTEPIDLPGNMVIQVTAYTHDQGQKLPVPNIELMVGTVGAQAIWTKIDQVTLSYAAKNLQLKPETHRTGKTDDGKAVEVMTVAIPYADFVALARADKFTVTVGNDSYEVDKRQATGIRELANRVGK